MKCPNCQAENPNTATFCNKCGARLEAPQGKPLPPAEKKKRGRGKTLIVVVGAAIVLCIVVAVIASLGGGGGKGATPTVAPMGEIEQPTEAAPTEARPGATESAPTKLPTDTPPPAPTDTPRPTDTPAATDTPVPTDTPAATDTPVPTDTPARTATPTSVPKPVVLKGTGQTATQEFSLPSSMSIAHFAHNGESNFIVEVYQAGNKELLINTIGAYNGERPLSGSDPVMLSIDADGAWTVEVRAVGHTDSAVFAGKGDDVSDLFEPPNDGPWQVKHDGQSNFVVYLHCAGGSSLVQNEIGSVNASLVVQFDDGPCLWEVQADGSWSLNLR